MGYFCGILFEDGLYGSSFYVGGFKGGLGFFLGSLCSGFCCYGIYYYCLFERLYLKFLSEKSVFISSISVKLKLTAPL